MFGMGLYHHPGRTECDAMAADERGYALLGASGDGSARTRSDLASTRAIGRSRARRSEDCRFDEDEAASEAYGPGAPSRDGLLKRRALQ